MKLCGGVWVWFGVGGGWVGQVSIRRLTRAKTNELPHAHVPEGELQRELVAVLELAEAPREVGVVGVEARLLPRAVHQHADHLPLLLVAVVGAWVGGGWVYVCVGWLSRGGGGGGGAEDDGGGSGCTAHACTSTHT